MLRATAWRDPDHWACVGSTFGFNFESLVATKPIIVRVTHRANAKSHLSGRPCLTPLYLKLPIDVLKGGNSLSSPSLKYSLLARERKCGDDGAFNAADVWRFLGVLDSFPSSCGALNSQSISFLHASFLFWVVSSPLWSRR